MLEPSLLLVWANRSQNPFPNKSETWIEANAADLIFGTTLEIEALEKKKKQVGIDRISSF